MFHKIFRCLGVGLAALFISACSNAVQSSVFPGAAPVNEGKQRTHGRMALTSNGGTMHSFAEAAGAKLETDDEYGAFVDPEVTGADRVLAIRLLKLMPPSIRGDFTYVDGAKILSNRIELRRNVRFAKMGDPQSLLPTRTGGSTKRAPSGYPPTGGSGGIYLRNYSQQGVNAAIGYATVPCNSAFAGNDNGFMYFNAYSATSTGSIVDAGLMVDATLRAHPFINNAGNNLYSGWTGEANNHTWPCGHPIGMMYGTLYGAGISVLMIGVPSYDPQVFLIPPNNLAWTDPAWNFFPTPFELRVGAGLSQGVLSPCTGCSVAKMFTISPASFAQDTSCFGLCNLQQTPEGRWDQVEMGQLSQPCNSTQGVSATCTLQYATDLSWYGGKNAGAGGSPANHYNVVTSIDDRNRGLEGIQTGRIPIVYDYVPPAGTFSTLIPIPFQPPCTPDVNGYCATEQNRTLISCFDTSGTEYDGLISNEIWRVYSTTAYLGQYLSYTYWDQSCTQPSLYWQTDEPAVKFNDPFLP